jgi:hypothetical protein
VTLTDPAVDLPMLTVIADQRPDKQNSPYARLVAQVLPMLPDPKRLAELLAQAKTYASYGHGGLRYPFEGLAGPYRQLLQHVELDGGLNIFAVRCSARDGSWTSALLYVRLGRKAMVLHHSGWATVSSVKRLALESVTPAQQGLIDGLYAAVFLAA